MGIVQAMASGDAAIQARSGWVRKVGGGVAAFLLVALAAFLLHRTLSRYGLQEIVSSLQSISAGRIALAGLFASASYLCLTGFDWLALHYIRYKLPYRKAALASFCSLSIGHNIGFAALSSGAIRYRFYSRWGVRAGDVAKIVIFCGTTVGLGLMVLAGFALVVNYGVAATILGLSETMVIGLGGACLTLSIGYLALCRFVRTPLQLRKWHIELPPFHLAVAQLLIGPINFAFVAACLHQVLSSVSDVSYFDVAAVYVIANVTALISHVPGGLGVIETVVLYLIPGVNVVGALIAFRAIYFFCPLCIGGPLFLATELLLRRRSVSRRRNRRTRSEQ